jgi:two-component system, chemotaxis family, chemotaxis protein CheY
MKVLVVDDSAMVRRQVGAALKGAGYEVVDAVDGVDAHQKLTADPTINMVICDVTMPRMSGIELLALVQREAVFKGSIVMLTTEARAELIAQARSHGAKGWLIKPLKPELLLATVAKLVA